MEIHNADCFPVLEAMGENSVDAVVTDPPYGIGILDEAWDGSLPGTEVWRECLRVLKPGGYLLAFSSARLYHRLAVSMEEAGFETQNMLAWLYGNGFPKGVNLSLMFDKSDGIPVPDDEFRNYLRAAIRRSPHNIRQLEEMCGTNGMFSHYLGRSQPAFPTTGKWKILKRVLKLDGRYDALFEKIERRRIRFRSVKRGRDKGLHLKSLTDNFKRHEPKSPLAKKWEGWRYGKACLRPCMEPVYFGQKPPLRPVTENVRRHRTGALNIGGCRVANENGKMKEPTNVMHDGSAAVARILNGAGGCGSPSLNKFEREPPFRYVPKPGKREKGEGNEHPTVKPLALMGHLVRLVTPPGGTVLDPFMGSGTTGAAAFAGGFGFVGIEKERGYFAVARERLKKTIIETITSKGAA